MFREDPDTFPFWTEYAEELGLIRIGLTEAFLETLGDDLIALEWLTLRGSVRKGDAIALLHTSRHGINVKAPFNMDILAINDEVVRDPRLLRLSPYFEGWVAEVRRRS